MEAYLHQFPDSPDLELRVRLDYMSFGGSVEKLLPEIVDIIVKEVAKGSATLIEKEIQSKLDKNDIANAVAAKLVEKFFLETAKEIDGKFLANIATAQSGQYFLKKFLPEIKQ